MATIVCQNLEPQLKESTTLRLKLSAPKPLFSSQSLQLAIKSCYVEPDKDESGSDCGGWAFLTEEKPKEKEVVNYVHPLHKRALSSHSLEMCTENLGSETGSDGGIFEDSDSPRTRKPRRVSCRRESGRGNLPPPLTTMSGSEYVRIRTHREDGRVVMEAVKGESSQTCFRSERSHGRLRLYIDESRADQNLDRQEQGVEETEERGYEGRSASVLEVKGEMGKEQIQRRCKKGGESERKGLMMPVWVATTS